LLMGTSLNDFFRVSRKVPPGGKAFADAIVIDLYVEFGGLRARDVEV
jgi:hypothetical protein